MPNPLTAQSGIATLWATQPVRKGGWGARGGLALSRVLAVALLLLLPLARAFGSAVGAEPVLLTSARQVHDLPAEKAEEALPIHLTATVTYYQPQEENMFVADATGGVYVYTTQAYPLHPGDLVDLEGVTRRSLKTVVAVRGPIRVLRAGHRFRATPVDYRRFMSGEVDCKYVSIRGRVRSASIENHGADTVAQLQVLMPGGTVQAYIQDYQGLGISGLIDAEVEISGIGAAEFNARFQVMRPKLFVSSVRELKLLRRPEIEGLNLPITDIDTVEATRFVLNQSKRVRVRGAITAYDPGYSMVIQHDGRSLFVQTRQIEPLPLGSVVDAIGFADDHAYSSVLEDAQILPTGQIESVRPQPVSYGDAMSGMYSDTLITLRGRVLSELHGDRSDTMVIMVDQHPVSVVMRRNVAASPQQHDDGVRLLLPTSLTGAGGQSAPLPDLSSGTLVTVSGICRVTPSIEWSKPLLFRLDMREASDLAIVARPSWWNVKHLLLVVAALVTLSLLIMAWVVVLRRRVSDQTERIERSIRVERQRSRLLEQINSETPLEQLLEDICSSIGVLVPGVHCSCILEESESGSLFESSVPPKGARLELVYEAGLTDARGRNIGVFRVGSTAWRTLSRDERETLAVGASLANLAVNQRRMYQELNYRSTHDQLTALPNRRLADMRLDSAVREATQRGTRVGVAYIDVDHFKQVNDVYGHKVGDLYLQAIALRLGAKVRSADLLARIGGDEFLLIATALGTLEDSEAYKRRLESCFQECFVLDDVSIRGSSSIGIAVFPDHGTTPEELKRYADTQMYATKHRDRLGAEQPKRGPESTDIFSPDELRAALEAGQFRLFYQPQFSAEGQFRGLEALLRLEDAILGIVAPDAFIGVAERSDVIFPLGAWVLRQALADAARWKVGTGEDARMVVNVSAQELGRPGFADGVALALLDSGVPATSLELEITERTALRNTGDAAEQLQRLRNLGVSISLDDFGTGESCLNVLHKLPVDTLKIDRSFVRAMGAEPGVLRVMDAILNLGRTLGKRVVAEGLESEEEIATLLKLGDMEVQGYVFSRPLPPEDLEANLARWRRGVAVRSEPPR